MRTIVGLCILLVSITFIEGRSHAGEDKRESDVERIEEINRRFAGQHSLFRVLRPYCFSCWYSHWIKPRVWKIPPRPGTLNKTAIDRVIKRNRHKLIRCANWSAIDQPEVTTRLELTFVIRPDGEVDKVTVETGKQKLTYLRDCLARKIKKLVFPRPDGFDPVEVTYPLVFTY